MRQDVKVTAWLYYGLWVPAGMLCVGSDSGSLGWRTMARANCFLERKNTAAVTGKLVWNAILAHGQSRDAVHERSPYLEPGEGAWILD